MRIRKDTATSIRNIIGSTKLSTTKRTKKGSGSVRENIRGNIAGKTKKSSPNTRKNTERRERKKKLKEIKKTTPEDEMKKEYELFLLTSLGMDIDEFIDKSCTFEEFKKMKEREKNQGIQG